MKEITNRQEVIEMVDAFYDKVNKDPLLSPIFNEIAGVHWETHLPKMYDFWDSLLLGTQKYRGRPFDNHLRLPISEKHFERWVSLFIETIDERFEGEIAKEAKVKAANIAGVFKFKMYSLGVLQKKK